MKAAASWEIQPAPSPVRILGGNQSRPRGGLGSRTSDTLFALTLVPLNLLASIQLLPVYGDWPGWLLVGLLASLVGTLIALIGPHISPHPYLQVTLLILSQFVLGPIITLNKTTLLHLLPTWQTLTQGWIATFGSFKALVSIDPPLGWEAGGFMALWTLLMWTSSLATLLARMRPYHRTRQPSSSINPTPLLALLPILCTMTISALLGTRPGWHPGPVGCLLWILLLLWASWRLNLIQSGRLMAKLLILFLIVGIGLGGTLVTPLDRLVLRDLYQPPIDPYQFTSPLSDYRSYIKNHKDDTLVTVHNLPAGTPVRMAVMDRFDGKVWNLSDSASPGQSSDYRRMGSAISISQDERTDTSKAEGQTFNATFTIHSGFGHSWLPTAGQVSSISPGRGLSRDDLYYNKGTDSALSSTPLGASTTYRLEGILHDRPSQETIKKSQAGRVQVPPTSNPPDSLSKSAALMASTQDKAGARALGIETKLHQDGWFSHGLQGDYPSPAGHGDYRINQLLQAQAMVGDSEQYASTMALLSRQMGLPSRVVLGFIPKDKEGSISKTRTHRDKNGQTQIDFTGRDAEAWVEINLEGLGWVPFYPTPQETKTPDRNLDLTPPNPKTLVRQPPPPLVDPPREDQSTNGRVRVGGQDVDKAANPSFWTQYGSIIIRILAFSSPVWIPILIMLSILLIKAWLLKRARRSGSPKQRIEQGWKQTQNLVWQSGLKLEGTRREQAQTIKKDLLRPSANTSLQNKNFSSGGVPYQLGQEVPENTDHDPLTRSTEGRKASLADDLDRLCRLADQATFSREVFTETEATRYWQLTDRVCEAILNSLPRTRRWRTRLSLRHLF